MDYEVGDIISCTVEKISGTIVFVIVNDLQKTQGSIIMSEIAPGRIRNIREYVVPKKRIVCKIIRVNSNGNLELSLRRVTQKEKKEILEKEKQEKSYRQILKSVLQEKSEDILEKILQKDTIYDFFEEAKQNPKNLEKIIPKKDAEKVLEIIGSEGKKKNSIIKKEFSLSTKNPDGLSLIKKILANVEGENVEIKYLSAGKYLIKKESENLKSADNEIKEILKEIEKDSKKLDFDFSYKEK